MRRITRPVRPARPARSLRGLGLALLLALSLPGAAAVAQSGSPAPSVAPSAVPGSPDPSAVPAPVTIHLVDNGRKPRAVRAYQLAVGTRQTVAMEVSQSVRTAIGNGVETSFEIPTIRYTMTATVDAVDPAGNASLTAIVDAVEIVEDPDAEEPLDPAVVEQLDSALRGLVGATFTATVTPSGRTLAAGADLSGLDPTIAQQVTGIMDQMAQQTQVFPDEPIGEGARWILVSTLTANGITFRNRQTVTLKQAEGTRLALAVETKQTGIPGPIALPGLPAGTTAEVEEMDGQGKSRSVVELTQPIPDSIGTSTVRAKLSATDGTQTQTTTSTVGSEVVARTVETPEGSPGASPAASAVALVR
jgi:hypothetical protein